MPNNMVLHRLPQLVSRVLSEVMENQTVNTAPIVLEWNAAAAPGDPNLEGSYAAPVPMRRTLPALVHWISARTVSRGFTDFQSGDAVISFEGAHDFAGLNGLTFLLPDGRTYVQTSAGKNVEEFWDVLLGGQRMTTTVAVRPTPGQERVVTAGVMYVDQSGATMLYAYDPAQRVLNALVDGTVLAQTATLEASPGALQIFFQAVPVLSASAVRVSAASFQSGSPYLENLPRLDFLLGGSVVCQLDAQGNLSADLLFECGLNPRLSNPKMMALEISGSDGVWMMSMAPGGLYVPAFLAV